MTFDPLTAVTSPEEWTALPQWARLPELARREGGLVVFSAHPDDETLGIGGLLAQAADEGIAVSIVVATGEPHRLSELGDALNALGLNADLRSLGLPDGHLKHHASELRDAIEAVLADSTQPSTVLAPWPGDRHGDHRTLGREVGAVAGRRGDRLLYYPVWLWQWGTPAEVPWERAQRIPSSTDLLRRKADALKAFASQLRGPGNEEGVLEPGFVHWAATGPEIVFSPERGDGVAHFERLHREREDPWSVRSRWYERRKLALVDASLPRERYGRGFEVGCSVGQTTAALAARCDELLAVDAAPSAVAAARRRTRDLTGTTVERMRIPVEWPVGDFDLIVVAEVAYYLAADEWAAAVELCRASLRPRGEVVLCHWTGRADDFAQSGEEAHARFRELSGMAAVVSHRDEEFLLEVFR